LFQRVRFFLLAVSPAQSLVSCRPFWIKVITWKVSFVRDWKVSVCGKKISPGNRRKIIWTALRQK
jgi:hypothetical protein